MEQWTPVLGLEGLYEASSLGSIRRISRGKLFTAEQVQEAKRRLTEGAKLKDVAAFLNTSVTTVMSIKHGKTWTGDETQRPMKYSKINSGYLMVHLCREGKYTRKLVHRIIWEAFNGPIPARLEVNHKDLDKANNNLENLELVTHKQNLIHRFATRKRAPNRPKI